jgi:non-specific serine/threonine protein kinase
MTPERWQRVTTLFRRARECDSSERSALLGEACGGDVALRREVESLLAVYDEPSDLLEEPLLAPGAGEALWAEAAQDVLKVTPTFVDEDPAPMAAVAGRSAAMLLGATLEGKYRIDALLGRGGMGEVYRATHLQLEREVAVKLIRADQVSDPAAFERFLREARMVARLRHPNVVTVYDYGVAAGVGAYIVMEYLRGHSLRAELRELKRLDAGRALEIIAQVCGAIVAAHAAGVLHRDIKPDNIFLEDGPRGPAVKVLDFGLAKLAEGAGSVGEAVTKRGAVLGTPAYMAPEQCLGREADARTDVYALGCLLYEMLTGRAPFAAPTTAALLYMQVHERPERPGELVPEIDPALEEVILRALAKEPEERPRTAESFARALGVREAANGPDTHSPIDVTTGGGALLTGALEGGAPGRRFGPTNLRHAVTRFVGRQREIAEVRERLAKTRLVTLVGPGGIGKTRLAVETAALVLGEHRDGVWLVELAGLADASLVDQVVASALDVREQGERPVVESLAERLHRKQLLLVLDNCEHLVDACARLAERLLEAAPGLRVLATSREALGIAGEAVWLVPALSVPTSADEAFESEAARLFADRASLARSSFEMTRSSGALVLELCRRLEGIPLAFELAAARVKALTVEQILERLDDRLAFLSGGSRTAPTRQQALQATLDWSYDLLTEAERALFRRLSVFVGGWELEAAEAVCAGGGIETAEVLNLLSRLVDKSLVAVYERERTTARYAMLEMVREYGLERLSQCGEYHEVRRRHAEYLSDQVEVARRAIWAGRSAEWLERLEVEHDNVRAALAWLLEHDTDGCLRLATAVSPFRELHGHLTESRRCLETALARSDASPALVRVDALLSAGMVASMQGDLVAARGFYEQGLHISSESGFTGKAAYLSLGLGSVVTMQGNLPAARTYLGESLALGRQMGNDGLVSQSLNSLGEVARLEQKWSAARDFYEQATAVFRRIEHDHSLIVVLCNLGAVLCESADLDAAQACYEEALTTSRALGSKELISLSVDGLGAIAARRGAWEHAARLAGMAEALLDEVGVTLAPVDLAFRDRYRAEARGHLGEAGFEAALAEGRALTVDGAVRVATEDSDR